MRRSGRPVLLPVMALLVASLGVVASGAPADASTCTRTWTGASDHTTWLDGGNWQPNNIPQGGEVVCIPISDSVVLGSGDAVMAELQLSGGARLAIDPTAGAFVNGFTQSVWNAGTSTTVAGQVGGSGIIRARGTTTFGTATDQGALASVDGPTGTAPPTDRGEMLVEGISSVTGKGLGLLSGFTMTVTGTGSVSVAPGSFMTGDNGTGLIIQSGGTVDLNGDGGFYRGAAVAGEPPVVLSNNGLLRKTGGTGTSVVDATYAGSGQVAVLTGTLAMPDNQQVVGPVSPGASLATGRCDTGPTAICAPTTNPAKDTMSMAFTVPPTNGSPATVAIQELGATGDIAQVGNEVLAHADNLALDTAHPARVVLRYSQADVMATPLDQVQVVHTTDSGQDVLLPDCAAGALPAGIYSCIQRPVVRDAQNTYVTVLTVTTSRWHLRRGLPVANQGAPSPPQGLAVKVGDGSALQVSWGAPASSGAGPLSSYRVTADGKSSVTTTGTSAVLRNLGPGKHTLEVVALNAAGPSPAVSQHVKLAELSKPRKVQAAPGAAGGKRTVKVSWKRPAAAGGFVIKRYQVAALDRGGAVVARSVVSGSKHRLVLTLGRGEVRLRVRAKNKDGFGPWSKPTEAVRPR